MSFAKIFKKVLLPCATGVTAIEGHTRNRACNAGDHHNPGTKPSELPIYTKTCSVCQEMPKESPPPSPVEETVGNLRRELWVWQDNLRGYRHKIIDVYRKGFSKADYCIQYLREPSHGTQRLEAIGLSAIAGYILGMRRGMFRRVLYATTGALGMAAICYPNESAEHLETIVLEARRLFIIFYHFIYGEPEEVMQTVDDEEEIVGSEQRVFVVDRPKPRECLCNPDPENPKPCHVIPCADRDSDLQ